MIIKVLSDKAHNLRPPQRIGDVGFDLCVDEDVNIPPLEARYIHTGVRIKLPDSTYARIIGRSHLFKNKRVICIDNVIDCGYTGELLVPLYNTSYDWPAHIQKGDRVAQLVVLPALVPQLVTVDALPHTARRSQGFGSTGS